MTRNAGSLARMVAVSAVVAGSLILAGCSGASNSADTPKAGASFNPKEKVTLEASWWGDDTRAALFHKVIQQFEAKYPNVTVKETPVGSPDDLFNRLATDFGGGGETAPDLFALGGAKPQEYGSAGALLDLSTVKNIVQSDKYPDFSLTSAKVDGKLYSLPTGGNATAAFVNTDIFKSAGLPVPDSSWTWDDLVSAADKIGSMGLKNAQGKPIYGLDLRVADILGTYAAQKTQYGVYNPKGKLDIGADSIADWYKIEKRLADGKGLPDPTVVTANQALPPDQQLYTLGQAAITFGYSNLIGSYSAGGTTQILPPPTDSKKNGVALLPSAFWAINAQTKHPAAAAELMNWFLNEPDPAKLILDTRGVPFNPAQAKVVTPLLQGPNKVAAEYVAQTLKSGTVAPPQPNGGANFNKYAQDAEAEVLFGKATPQQASEDFIKKLSTDLAQSQG
jgi:multiple sugar transport system substrate-binding protein